MVKKWRLNQDRDVVYQLSELYGTSSEELSPVKGGLVNVIYEFKKNGKWYILRVSTHKTRQEIQSELEWILFLHENGVSVSKPVPSIQNNLIETVQYQKREFYCVSYKKAIGKSLLKDAESLDLSLWNEDLWINLGRTMGKLHEITKKYTPKSSLTKYKHIDDNPIFNEDGFSGQPRLKTKLSDLSKKILSLPRPKNAFGLVHNDINLWNFVLSKDALILFDFDDCGYNWYIHDITTTIHLISTYILSSGQYSSFHQFIRAFWRGYNAECSLNSYWISLIPLFLRFRLFHDYFLFNRMYMQEEFDPEDMGFFSHIINDLEKRIYTDRPFIDLPVEIWLQLADST
ncbi:MAG: phosphotransferase [Candidatus Heimdallarchaeota archaeon]|nr:MAG: phosphotransferase [Candidatus Heimdallarchaeota archaeon]